MAIKNSLRNVVDRKEWEFMTPATIATGAGTHTITDPSGEDRGTLIMYSNTAHYRYDHNHDAFQAIPPSGITGTFGAGSCGTYHPLGTRGTVRATGTTTTVPTSLTLNWQLNYKIRFTAGPNAGLERRIASNTLGANSVLTLDSPLPTSPTTATQFVLLSGSFYFFNAGSKGFAKYDRALNTWAQLNIASPLPSSWGTEGQLIATSMTNTDGFANGLATGGTTTTLVNSAKTWAINEWSNYQVRFTSGANAGQVRVITSNTATTLTFATALGSAVASGDSYVLEGNEDLLLLFGNGANTAYQYNITANTWETYATTNARAAPAGAGMTDDWVFDVSDPTWRDEPNVLNGRYIYSFRGGGQIGLDRLDLTTKKWEEVNFVPRADSFTTGSSSDYDDKYIYISKEATGQIFRFNIIENRLVPWSRVIYPSSTAVAGDKMWVKVWTDPITGEQLKWVYYMLHTSNVLMRCMVIQ